MELSFALKHVVKIEGLIESNSFIQTETDVIAIRRIYQALSSIYCTLLDYKTSLSDEKMRLNALLQTMLNVSKHPSYIISSYAFPFWCQALKHQNVVNVSFYKSKMVIR